MKKAHTSPRLTGNKTQTKPKSVKVKGTSVAGIASPGQLKRGYDVKRKLPVLSSPTTEPNNKP